MGQCTGNEVKLEFIDDVNQDYHYNQFSANTLTDGVLLDLNMQASMAHVQVIRDFIMKRNFTLILKSTALDPRVERSYHQDLRTTS